MYALCRGVVVPTKFEAASGPVFEAFLAGAATACSNVTSLPEQAGDGALLFDPDDDAEIARVIELLWTDAELRTMLVEHARERITRFAGIAHAERFARSTDGQPDAN